MIALKQGTSFLDTLRRHVAIIEAAPEAEAVFVGAIELYHLLKGTTDPGAMHNSSVQHADLIHILAPLGNLLRIRAIVMGVHVDNIELSTLHAGSRDVVHYGRIEITEQNLIRGISRLLRFLGRITSHQNGHRNQEKYLLHHDIVIIANFSRCKITTFFLYSIII